MIVALTKLLSMAFGAKPPPTARLTDPELTNLALFPSEGGVFKQNHAFRLDFTNRNEGYIIGTYLGDANKKCKVRITHGDEGFNFSAFSGRPTVFPLTYGDGKYKIEALQQIEGNRYSSKLSLTIDVRLRNSMLPNLYPNTYVDYAPDSLCVAKANEICRGLTTDVEMSKALYHWVLKNIKYDHKKAVALTEMDGGSHWFVPNPDLVLMDGRCVCFGFASLLAAMHRCLGIPCRVAIGTFGGNVRHAWNELYWDTAGSLNKYTKIPAKKFTLVDVTFNISQGDRKCSELISKPDNYVTEYRG